MKKSVTQKHDFGCGIACVSFVVNKKYLQVVSGLEYKATNKGFLCKDLIRLLKRSGFNYRYSYILNQKIHNKQGVIIYIQKSKRYPVGHYLVRYRKLWMDPWINFNPRRNIKIAYSGFRKRLPGKPIYIIYPVFTSLISVI